MGRFAVQAAVTTALARRLRRRDDRQEGQVLVLFSLVFVVILAFASLVIDIGMLRNDRQTLANAMDAGALAGGTLMPVDGSVAGELSRVESLVHRTVHGTFAGLSTSDYTITYRCLIGVDSSVPARPYISRDIPLACDPSKSLGRAPVEGDFRGAGPTRYVACNPAAGDRCNVVVLAGAVVTPFSFGGVVGVTDGSTGTVTSAACNGPCGEAPVSPVDVVLIMDRTGSMNGTDTTNAKAAANSIVSIYNPAIQWLGLGTLGPSTTSGGCQAAPAGSIGTANAPADLRRWVPVGLSGTGSTYSSTYAPVTSAISCYTNSSTGTDLADPVAMAAYELIHNGRPGVRKGIILETDGQPNAAVGSGPNYCALASAAATSAKAQGIEIFTIGFGLDAASGGDPNCPDTSGAWKGKTATQLLASMSTQPTTGTTTCSDTENADDDHFYCIGKTGASTDLSDIFKAAATQLAKGKSRLVQLDPVPVLTAISPASGGQAGGTSVTISGSYFTGATSVRFGGAAATFTVLSDTSIIAVAPAGTAGTAVDVRVETSGGVTTVVPGGRFNYQ